MTLRERLVALAEDVPMIATEREHAQVRALALAAARMALEDAAKECGKDSLAQIGIRALRDGLE